MPGMEDSNTLLLEEAIPANAPENAEGACSSSIMDAEKELLENTDDIPLLDELNKNQHGPWQGELPPSLMQAVDLRLDLWQQVLSLEDRREKLLAMSGTRDTRGELTRQTNELKRIPELSIIQAMHEKLRAKKEQPIKPDQAAEYRYDENDPSALDFPTYQTAVYDLGITQCRLLEARARMDQVVVRAAKSLASAEPLTIACKRVELDTESLVGWTYYCLGVELRQTAWKEAEQTERQRIEQEMEEARKSKKKARGEAPVADPSFTYRRKSAERELAAIEPMLADSYWDLYEKIAWLYVSGKFTEDEEVAIRAYLRYGLVAIHPGLISTDTSAYILKDCRDDVYRWSDATDAMHVVYPDEYIRAIYNKETTVSPDEELDLNERGSDRWKADRIWRNAVIGKLKLGLFMKTREEIASKVAEYEKICADLQIEIDTLKEAPDKKAELVSARERMADARRELARLQQQIDRLDQKLLPNLQAMSSEAQTRMESAYAFFPPEAIIQREAQFVRRMARLSARLKTPYLQWILRDQFVPERDDHFTRASIKEFMQHVEWADQYLFHQVVVPNKKRDRRLTVRMSPTVLIIPARGIMGLSLNPRRSNDAGKLMLPLMSQRTGMLKNMTSEILADFGWDCSMEEAGADWIAADALCSAYANIRWNYRSKSPKSQKRAGFDKKKKDRQDWRFHYSLYLSSIEEGARQLFNKCTEVYEVVVKYIGLPDGVERLRRD